MKHKYLLCLTINCIFNANALAIEKLTDDFSKNSATVTSVSEKFADEVRDKAINSKESLSNILKKNCRQEIEIFCSNEVDTYNCLKNNFNLTTGQCNKILKVEFKKGISYGRLSIHDLKLTKDTKLLKNEEALNFRLATYKTKNVFDYRGLRFRKGFFQARNYNYEDYNGQFVVFSGKPKTIFKDASGISYNPYLQKGPFFFDEKGNVKIGTLNQEYEYKKHVYLKKGSIVVFNDDRTLKKGILGRSVRIGRCGYLSGMEISEEIIAECVE